MKKVTTDDIAKAVGVSRATVSYVLNDVKGKSISEEKRLLILKTAKEMDYTPDFFARGLKTRTSQTVALIVPNLTDPTIANTIKGVDVAASQCGYSLIIQDRDTQAQDIARALNSLRSRAVDGMIYAYPYSDKEQQALLTLSRDQNMPLVSIGCGVKGSAIKCVSNDHRASGLVLAEHLCRMGHRRMAMVVTDGMSPPKQLRLEGINECVECCGGHCDLIIVKSQAHGSLFFDKRGYEMGNAAAQDIVRGGLSYTAVIAFNTFIAAGMLNAFKRLGLSVPEDVSVTSFGNHFIAEIIDPPLTDVDHHYDQLGLSAFSVLKRVIDRTDSQLPDTTLLAPALVARASVGPPGPEHS